MTPIIDEAYKIIMVAAIVDTKRFRGVWRGQSYEARALPDTSDLTVGDAVVCFVLPGTTELVAVRRQLLGVDCIIIWSGAIVDIPTGWQLCDGTGGTPDLRDYFVKALGWSTGDMGATEGADTEIYSHRHGAGVGNLQAESGHIHVIEIGKLGRNIEAYQAGAGTPDSTGVTADTQQDHEHDDGGGLYLESIDSLGGTSHTHNTFSLGMTPHAVTVDSRPPYYAMAYISGTALPPVGGIVWYYSTFERAWDAYAVGDYSEAATTVQVTLEYAVGTYPAAPFVASTSADESVLVTARTSLGGFLEEWEITRGYDGTLAQPIYDWDNLDAPFVPVPAGYVVCDGTGGTPNLGGRFIVGAGSAYALAANGGPSVAWYPHGHDVNGVNLNAVAHNHTIPGAWTSYAVPPPEPGMAGPANDVVYASSYALKTTHRHWWPGTNQGSSVNTASHSHVLTGQTSNPTPYAGSPAPKATILVAIQRIL